MSSTTSNSSRDSLEESSRKRPLNPAILVEEEIEPYVRRKRSDSASDKTSERSKKRLDALNEEEQNLLRTCINSRERRRMHDLNDALDDLRSVIPYSENSNSRKMSKINTIILATNWIRQLTTKTIELKEHNEKMLKQMLSLEVALRSTNNNNTNSETPTTSNAQQTETTTTTSSIPQTNLISDIFAQKSLENKNPTPLLMPFIKSNFNEKFLTSNNAFEGSQKRIKLDANCESLENNLQIHCKTGSLENSSSNIVQSGSLKPPNNDSLSNNAPQFQLAAAATILQATSTNNTVCKRSFHENDTVCPCMSCILSSGCSTKPNTATILTGSTRRKPCAAQIRKMPDSLMEDFKSDM